MCLFVRNVYSHRNPDERTAAKGEDLSGHDDASETNKMTKSMKTKRNEIRWDTCAETVQKIKLNLDKNAD